MDQARMPGRGVPAGTGGRPGRSDGPRAAVGRVRDGRLAGALQGMRRAAALLALALAAAPVLAQELRVEGGCRDGQPHGAYTLRMADGQVRVAGAFSSGRRTGSFVFWSTAGARIAQLPYDDDALAGTVALWYAEPDAHGDPKPKVEAGYVGGRLSGRKRSWYPNGRLRTEYRYANGALVEAHAFTDAGAALSDATARVQAARDLATDQEFYGALEAFVRGNLPHCEPASDRLEKAS
jgi:hypothetical protein